MENSVMIERPFVAELAPGYVTNRLGSSKALERGVDEPRQCAQVVAAFQYSGAARREALASARELPEAALGDVHGGERIVGVRVESGGHDHELRVERAHRRLADGVEGAVM